MSNLQSETSTEIECVVVGAGVIGAAVALSLVQKNKSVVVLEAATRVAEGITSRNSGVIHSGIYYPPDSLKARLCVRGNHLLYEWAERHGVSFRKTGKVILAKSDSEAEALEDLFKNASRSGAPGLSRWGQSQISGAMPQITGKAAIFASATGIVDPYELTRSYLQKAEEHGALVLTDAAIKNISPSNGGYVLDTARGQIKAEMVFNAAGLHADDVARLAGVDSYRIYPCRGDYFRFRSASRYPHLLYPIKAKSDSGLGIHLTLDINGGMRLGPDAEYVESKTDLRARVDKLEKFRVAAERLLGPISPEQLQYDQCGIRPKLRAPNENQERDFVISEDLPGFFNLVGIESPGLTASLAIGEYVVQKL